MSLNRIFNQRIGLQNNGSSKRVVWIDYVKAFAITIVVLLHMQLPDPYSRILYSFIIPLFFLLAGLFSHPDRYGSFVEFLKYKISRLLGPYIFFSVLNYGYWLLVARHVGADAETTISLSKPIAGILLGYAPWMYHYKPLWFLPCLIGTEMLFFLMYKSCIRKTYLLAMGVVGLTLIGYLCSVFQLPPLPYSFSGSCCMLIFYYIGFCAMQKREWLANVYRRYNPMVICGTAVLLLFLCCFLSMSTSETRVSQNNYGNLLYAFPAALFGCSAVIGLCIVLEKLGYSKTLAYVGSHTLPILGLHLTVAGWIKGTTTFIFHLPLEIYDALYAKFLLGIAVVIACIPCCLLYDKIEKYLLIHH